MIDFAVIYEEKSDEEHLKFEDIAPERRLHVRPDLNAFLLLHRLVSSAQGMVAGAEHDEIYLEVDVEELNKVATEEDAIDLIRCGVRYDPETEGLAMFA